MNRKNSKPSTTITFALLLVLVALLFVTFLPPAHAGGNVAVTRTFQPSSADCYLDEQNKNSNRGDLAYIKVESESGKNDRTLLTFDLTEIPSGSTVESATLSLNAYVVPGAGRTYEAWQTTSSWGETTVTWNTPPSYAGSASASAGEASGWMEWSSTTLTSDVQGWVTGSSTNYGWMINDSVEDTATEHNILFYSRREATQTTLRPKLTVRYTAPWDSHETSYTGPVCDIFSDYGTEHTVYMRGTGFNEESYNVVFWDGDYDKRVTDASLEGGVLDSEHTFVAGTDVAGLWHASAYVGVTPTEYSDKTNLRADDSFTVVDTAIPEFPDVIAAIAVCLLCAVAYVVMRRRAEKG